MQQLEPSATSAGDRAVPNRRVGPRRVTSLEVQIERRQTDRRRLPGLEALLRDLLRPERSA
jgi:hypothetical protein